MNDFFTPNSEQLFLIIYYCIDLKPFFHPILQAESFPQKLTYNQWKPHSLYLQTYSLQDTIQKEEQ